MSWNKQSDSSSETWVKTPDPSSETWNQEPDASGELWSQETGGYPQSIRAFHLVTPYNRDIFAGTEVIFNVDIEYTQGTSGWDES